MCAELAEAPLTGNEVLGAVVVRFMAVRAFEGANVRVGDECIRALAGDTLTPEYRKALQTGFTFYEPDQGHVSANLTNEDISIRIREVRVIGKLRFVTQCAFLLRTMFTTRNCVRRLDDLRVAEQKA